MEVETKIKISKTSKKKTSLNKKINGWRFSPDSPMGAGTPASSLCSGHATSGGIFDTNKNNVFERVDHECTYLQSHQKCTTPARQGSGTMVDCFVDMNRNISNISTSSTTSITNGVGGSTYTYVMLI